MQTCYDMRFAEAAIGLRTRGAEVLTFPSAFTPVTGVAHWGSLLPLVSVANVKLMGAQRFCYELERSKRNATSSLPLKSENTGRADASPTATRSFVIHGGK